MLLFFRVNIVHFFSIIMLRKYIQRYRRDTLPSIRRKDREERETLGHRIRALCIYTSNQGFPECLSLPTKKSARASLFRKRKPRSRGFHFSGHRIQSTDGIGVDWS